MGYFGTPLVSQLRRSGYFGIPGPGGFTAPVNVVLPVVTGTTGLGDTLTCSDGTWIGDPPPTYTYQWQRNGVNILGETANTHVIVAADQGTTLTCEVTATNVAGAVMAESTGTAVPGNTVAPVLGEAYAGASPTVTAGTWTGSPTLTYSLTVNAVEVVAGTEAQIEAYVYVLGDEGYNAILYEIPNGDTAAQVASNTVVVDLAAKIVALYTAVAWTVRALFLVRRSALDLTLVGSAVSAWLDKSGLGNDATQATAGARPTYSATAINGKPGMTFDGGDWLATAAIDPAGATGYVGHMITRTDNNNTARRVFAWGADGLALNCDKWNAYLWGYGTGNVGVSQVAGTTAGLGTAAVTDVTWDVTRSAALESRVRRAGVDITTIPPSVENTAGMAAAAALTIGGGAGGTALWGGGSSALVIATGATTIPATVATVDAILKAAWAL